MDPRTILIGNDHGGYELALHVVDHLKKQDLPCEHTGSYSGEIVRYPYYAAKVASAISRGEIRRGILVCSTGIGMSILANRFLGVRASLCTSTFMGKMTRAHNDSNCLCLGGRITGYLEALDILDAWLHTPYDGGRHDISLGLIAQAEQRLCRPGGWIPEGPVR